MRKRYVLAAGAALAMLGTAGVLYAETADNQGQSETPRADTSAITLPTGDVVKVTPQGTVGVSPAEGREDAGFFRAQGPGDDVVMVPIDRAADIQAGEEDPRRYNVSALVEAGFTDASQATESQLDDREYRGLVPVNEKRREPSADAQEVTVTLRDADGEVPAFDWVLWASLDDDDEFDGIEFDDNGVGKVELEPGSYDLPAVFGDSDPQDGDAEGGNLYNGMSTFTVKDEPVELTLDGSEAEQLSASVDNDEAVKTSEKLDIGAPGSNTSTYTLAGAKFDHFVLPSETGTSEGLRFQYGTTVSTPDDAADPALYNLSFVDTQGIPEDLAFTAADSELAAVDTNFESFGADNDDGIYCMTGITEGVGTEFVNCLEQPLPLSQNRTVYFTPGDTQWHGYSGAGTDEDFLIFETAGRSFDEGTTGSESPHSAPITLGLVDRGITRDSEGLSILSTITESFDPNTFGWSGAFEGTVTLSNDGEELDSYEGPLREFAGFALDSAEEGRFQVSVEAAYDGDVIAIGTAGKATWEFDAPAAPGEDEEIPVDASAVYMDSEGVENGFAEAGAELPVTLEYRPQPDGEESGLEDLKFQVSYDEGENWDEVDTDRDGNTATATLQSPEDAESVSVRFIATDAAGSQLQQETLRSFLLK